MDKLPMAASKKPLAAFALDGRKQLKAKDSILRIQKLDALFDKWRAEMKLNRKLNFEFLPKPNMLRIRSNPERTGILATIETRNEQPLDTV